MKTSEIQDLDILVPIALELDWPSCESIVEDILFLKEKYGFSRFALAGPGGGWRSRNYPPRSVFENLAHLFAEVQKQVAPRGAECGWWITTTLKSGPSPDFTRMTNPDGTTSAFANCPQDPAFIKQFASDVAAFARIAQPAFIVTEDDYSVNAALKKDYGCFCSHHLNAFARRMGHYYTPDELMDIFSSQDAESLALLKSWRQLMCDSLTVLADAVRTELDKCNPEIPMGYMQSGACDMDGDCTEPLSRAMAGPNHVPFSRFFGAFYCGGDTKDIPKVFYHPLYSRQHIKENFRYYHESDTFPHTRFFTSGKQMKVFMSAAYSCGFDGSVYQAQQLLDHPNEETAFGKMYASERIRLNALHRAAVQCRQKGVQICYDPFYNTIDTGVQSTWLPLWTKSVSLFGIPYTTLPSSVAFWDVRQAKYADHDAVMQALSKGLFLDGDAAKALCERGYSKYIGVKVGENVTDGNTLIYDLGAREVIRDNFLPGYRGRNMPSAHMFAPAGNGKLLGLTVNDPGCEVISEMYDFQKNFIATAMTRFENNLGGRIVVMGMTIDGNGSQSLLNYRRQMLFQDLLKWSCDDYLFAQKEPGVYVIENEAKNPEESGFAGMLTLINLCEDTLDSITLHLPPRWQARTDYKYLDIDGVWKDVKTIRTRDTLEICMPLPYSEPVYIMAN